MFFPKLPERTLNHRTDTIAVRNVGMKLGADMLIRSMDDRDYGVDLLIEHFTNSEVAHLLFFQVKGTTEKINPLVTNTAVISCTGFPKHTALYAEQFTQPFIVAYTSVVPDAKGDFPVYYLWMQRYIEHYLDVKDFGWRTSSPETLTLHFPVQNTLDGKNFRLKAIAASAVIDFQAFKVIKLYARLQVLLDRPGALKTDDFEEILYVTRSAAKCMLAINSCQPPQLPLNDFATHRLKPLEDQIKDMTASPKNFDADQLREKVSNLYRGLTGVVAINLSAGILPQTWCCWPLELPFLR